MLSNLYRNRKDFYTKKRTIIDRKTYRRNVFGRVPYWQIKGFIDFLYDRNFCKDDYEVRNGIAILNIPEKFSFTKAPEATIFTLQRLVGMYKDNRVEKIYIDHCRCNELEIGASLLMDAIIWEMNYGRNLINKKISFQGIMKHEKENKENEDVISLLACSGVLKHLGIINNISIPENIETLDFYDGYIKKHKNIDHKYAGQAVAEYFDRCYGKCGFKISDDGINKLSDLVSEIVLNCDNHCGDTPRRWLCQGHYTVCKEKTGRVGECQLTIISIGNTFYDSINIMGTDFIKDRIEKQYEKVDKNWQNFWGLMREKKKKELYYLLYCLQENISRFKNPQNVDRGKGTRTLFENFQELGKTSDGRCPTLSIISGSGYILFDGKYRMTDNDNGIKVIAFNEMNDLELEPDYKYVHTIGSFFPGVVISLKFYIDEDYLEKVILCNG